MHVSDRDTDMQLSDQYMYSTVYVRDDARGRYPVAVPIRPWPALLSSEPLSPGEAGGEAAATALPLQAQGPQVRHTMYTQCTLQAPPSPRSTWAVCHVMSSIQGRWLSQNSLAHVPAVQPKAEPSRLFWERRRRQRSLFLEDGHCRGDGTRQRGLCCAGRLPRLRRAGRPPRHWPASAGGGGAM